jgi:hypothetical protein
MSSAPRTRHTPATGCSRMQPPGYVPWAERWPSRWKPSTKRMTATIPSSSPRRTTTFDVAHILAPLHRVCTGYQ